MVKKENTETKKVLTNKKNSEKIKKIETKKIKKVEKKEKIEKKTNKIKRKISKKTPIKNTKIKQKIKSNKNPLKKRKKQPMPKIKLVQTKAKRKTAIASATIKEGKGRFVINKKPLHVIENKYLKMLVEEPLKLVESYNKDYINQVDILIKVLGGGQVSQILASRSAIAKGLEKYYDDENITQIFNKYDKKLLVDDVRRKEPKKQLGRGARARRQQSKR